MNKMPLSKAYDPQATEDRIYRMWEESGAFIADAKTTKETFTISMPPPNATGNLHLGHAVMLALEDIFIRFQRMRGKEALWVPGTDHAAIATESVVIKKIQKEESLPDPRGSLGREELLKRIQHFVQESRGTIRSQIRKMGSSCDWSRERYTMDASLNRCVNEVFCKMYADGLIYRGNRVVNWDVALQTTISDDEIEHKDVEGTLYTIEYLPAALTGGEPVYVATSRPETKLGDNALAVHPEDERYKHLIGKSFDVEWPRGQKITVTIIADHLIDPQFGTGVLGLTPYHSKIDFELGQRHRDELKAEPIQVIGEDGKITAHIKGYEGMTVEECRTAFVEELRSVGRLKAEEKYVQPLSISYRSKQPVEPLPKLQWFIDVNKKVVPWGKTFGIFPRKMSLKEIMQNVVQSGAINIIPERFEKTYFHWIDNLQDWCISRQIWWGHRIPVYYCTKCVETKNGKEEPMSFRYIGSEPYEVHKACGSPLKQDPDTLDTWFSSALWTWSTLVDPKLTEDYSLSLKDILEKSPDFQTFHPTQVMETGYDIIFFWVARMILMTTYATGQIPFDTVYLHGLIRTREGKKMSKSDPETMIDPLDIIEKYGADALRLSMIVGQSPGNDSRLYEEKIAGYRNFVNKLWNASRFILMQCEKAKVDPASVSRGINSAANEMSLADRALLSELNALITDVSDGLEQYRLSEVGEKLYSFTWDFFCDWYLELSKGSANLPVLIHTMRTLLILLHPYIPFVTEELWSHFKHTDDGMLLKASWPSVQSSFNDQPARSDLQVVIDAVSSLRALRSEYNVEPGKNISVVFVTKTKKELLESQANHIKRMARVESLTIQSDAYAGGNAASAFTKDVEVHIPLEGLIDIAKEKERLGKEQQQLQGFLKGVEAKLSNQKFVSSAPQAVVEKEKQKAVDAKEKLQKLEQKLAALS